LTPASFVLPFIQSSALLDNITQQGIIIMKFVLWQQQMSRSTVIPNAEWVLDLDREIVVEGPSREWCQAMFVGSTELNAAHRLNTINVMPYEDWKVYIDKWAESDPFAAEAALIQMETRGFVNYPANTPTHWCDSYKERVAAV
jgi:hypothetical protein